MDKEQYGKELFIVTHKLRRFFDKHIQKNGIYVGQGRILNYLYKRKDEKTYQKDIESAFQIRGGSVTGIIDALVAQNYISRVESESDKRRRKIVLTEEGEKMAQQSKEAIDSAEASLAALFSKEEKKNLSKIIIKINAWIDSEENK